MTSAAYSVQETGGAETAEILALYPQAFPDEDLCPLVSALLRGAYHVLSLGARSAGVLVGHVLFTPFRIGEAHGALLGPLGVVPFCQRRGVGSALVEAGLRRLEASGTAQAFVLGDPGFYGRFGFRTEGWVAPPYPLPDAWDGAWQSLVLARGHALPTGDLTLPDPWMDPGLWQA